MTRFIVANDGDGEPCIFMTESPVWSSQLHPVALIRRSDLPPGARHVWDDLVAAVLAGQERAEVTQRPVLVTANPGCPVCSGFGCPDCPSWLPE